VQLTLLIFISTEANEKEETLMSSLSNEAMDRFLKTDAKQILLASSAFKLAPNRHLVEIDNNPVEEDANQ
jgi:hypothetical protein